MLIIFLQPQEDHLMLTEEGLEEAHDEEPHASQIDLQKLSTEFPVCLFRLLPFE
jgi:hypothetical protein